MRGRRAATRRRGEDAEVVARRSCRSAKDQPRSLLVVGGHHTFPPSRSDLGADGGHVLDPTTMKDGVVPGIAAGVEDPAPRARIAPG